MNTVYLSANDDAELWSDRDARRSIQSLVDSLGYK